MAESATEVAVAVVMMEAKKNCGFILPKNKLFLPFIYQKALSPCHLPKYFLPFIRHKASSASDLTFHLHCHSPASSEKVITEIVSWYRSYLIIFLSATELIPWLTMIQPPRMSSVVVVVVVVVGVRVQIKKWITF